MTSYHIRTASCYGGTPHAWLACESQGSEFCRLLRPCISYNIGRDLTVTGN